MAAAHRAEQENLRRARRLNAAPVQARATSEIVAHRAGLVGLARLFQQQGQFRADLRTFRRRPPFLAQKGLGLGRSSRLARGLGELDQGRGSQIGLVGRRDGERLGVSVQRFIEPAAFLQNLAAIGVGDAVPGIDGRRPLQGGQRLRQAARPVQACSQIVVRGRQRRQKLRCALQQIEGLLVAPLPGQQPAQGVQARAGMRREGDMSSQQRFGLILIRSVREKQGEHA